MEVSKQLTSKSGITVPKNIRSAAGWHPKMAVDVKVIDEGVLITKHVPTCNFCGAIEKVAKVMEIEICINCAKAIYEGVQKK